MVIRSFGLMMLRIQEQSIGFTMSHAFVSENSSFSFSADLARVPPMNPSLFFAFNAVLTTLSHKS